MVARIQQKPGDLIVTFSRRGEKPESILCVDGHRAAEHGTHMLAKNRPLQSGDLLFIHHDGEVATWPYDRFADFVQEG